VKEIWRFCDNESPPKSLPILLSEDSYCRRKSICLWGKRKFCCKIIHLLDCQFVICTHRGDNYFFYFVVFSVKFNFSLLSFKMKFDSFSFSSTFWNMTQTLQIEFLYKVWISYCKSMHRINKEVFFGKVRCLKVEDLLRLSNEFLYTSFTRRGQFKALKGGGYLPILFYMYIYRCTPKLQVGINSVYNQFYVSFISSNFSLHIYIQMLLSLQTKQRWKNVPFLFKKAVRLWSKLIVKVWKMGFYN